MKGRTFFPVSGPFTARMNRRAMPLIIGSLVLPLGCGGDGSMDPNGPLVLQPTELCSENPGTAIVTFSDANLEAAIRSKLGIGAQDELTCDLVSGVTTLTAPDNGGIESLGGIQNLTSLESLDVDENSITDISALSGLTSLERIELTGNSITDISVLSGLTSLTSLSLGNNSISDVSALSGLTSLLSLTLFGNPDLTDIQPLLDNTGLGASDTVSLHDTNVSCTDVAALEAKGVLVTSDCP